MADAITSAPTRLDSDSLVDALDRVLDVGAVVAGDVVVSVADIDLLYLNLRLLAGSVETLRGAAAGVGAGAGPSTSASRLPRRRTDGASQAPTAPAAPAASTTSTTGPSGAEIRSPRVDLDAPHVDAGLAQLVHAVLDLLRELIERQAVRRFEAGSLTDEEAERLGNTLSAMRDRIARLGELISGSMAGEPNADGTDIWRKTT
jgi:hypothetical protein